MSARWGVAHVPTSASAEGVRVCAARRPEPAAEPVFAQVGEVAVEPADQRVRRSPSASRSPKLGGRPVLGRPKGWCTAAANAGALAQRRCSRRRSCPRRGRGPSRHRCRRARPRAARHRRRGSRPPARRRTERSAACLTFSKQRDPAGERCRPRRRGRRRRRRRRASGVAVGADVAEAERVRAAAPRRPARCALPVFREVEEAARTRAPRSRVEIPVAVDVGEVRRGVRSHVRPGRTRRARAPRRRVRSPCRVFAKKKMFPVNDADEAHRDRRRRRCRRTQVKRRRPRSRARTGSSAARRMPARRRCRCSRRPRCLRRRCRRRASRSPSPSRSARSGEAYVPTLARPKAFATGAAKLGSLPSAVFSK